MASNDDRADELKDEDDSKRRPYRTPKLRALGSVREVTWGPSPQAFEGGFKGTPNKGGK